MFWSKLCKSNWNCAWNLAFPVFISPIVWNMCENLHYESVYFKELHDGQEYYWQTIYRAGAAVVWAVTSTEIDLKGNENCFELAGGSSYRGFDLRVTGSRLYCHNHGPTLAPNLNFPTENTLWRTMAGAESSDTPWVSLFSVAYDQYSGYINLGASHYYPFYGV